MCMLVTLTGVECLQLVSGDLGIVHALKEWRDASIFLAPEVICN